ncbi:LAFA_0F02344g1_1 [Lachancea sp. 'fantastica']|nr:LAFA_0F02344g1_1 [Lachancea sp. 'fantastica']
MNLFGNLEDPWKSDQLSGSPAAQNEWASLNTDPLTSSGILGAEASTSKVETFSGHRSKDARTQDVQFDTSSLIMGQQDGDRTAGWGETLGDVNNHVSKGLSKGDMLTETPFAESADQSNEPHAKEDYEHWLDEVRKKYNPLSPDIIMVEEIPEREGLLFKHTNYLVRHLVELPDTEPASDKSVVRRYSDFVWLQEVLLKKYPFRMIPDLPPKKIGSHNADPIFLIKRLNGLSRFINLLVKHPVLKTDDLLLTFLTVPTDLLGWRKNANYDTTDEFTDKKIGMSFIKMWHKEMAERWNEADASIDTLLDLWAKITILIERYEKRMKFISQDRILLASMIDDFAGNTTRLFSSDTSSTVLEINDHLNVVSKHLGACNKIALSESEEMKQELSPRFRTFIDILLALKGLFERYKIMAGNTVPQLQRRIELSTERLDQMKDKPDLKGAEYDKVKQSIQRDRRSIAQQMNKSWLIRECILEEYVYFQETQFLITDNFQRWAKLNMNYMELNSNEWEKLLNSIESMPVSRS